MTDNEKADYWAPPGRVLVVRFPQPVPDDYKEALKEAIYRELDEAAKQGRDVAVLCLDCDAAVEVLALTRTAGEV